MFVKSRLHGGHVNSRFLVSSMFGITYKLVFNIIFFLIIYLKDLKSAVNLLTIEREEKDKEEDEKVLWSFFVSCYQM